MKEITSRLEVAKLFFMTIKIQKNSEYIATITTKYIYAVDFISELNID